MKTYWKRIIAISLIIVLVICMQSVPISVFAETRSNTDLWYTDNELLELFGMKKELGSKNDNNSVIVTDSDGNVIKHNFFNTTREGYTSYFTNSCPYGSNSNYTYDYGTEIDRNVAFSMYIKDVATTTFISVFSMLFDAYGTLAEQIFRDFYNFLKDTDPQIDAVSYIAYVKTHNSYRSGYIAPIFSYAYYYDIALFSETNCWGSFTRTQTYKVKLTV